MATITDKKSITLREVLAVLPKGERQGKKLRTTCPKCHQPHLDVEEKRGKVLVHCWTDGCEGAWDRIVELVEARHAKRQEEKETLPAGLILERYAEMKCLPIELLTDWYFMQTMPWPGLPSIPAVVFPYPAPIATRGKYEMKGFKFRLSESSHDARWEAHQEAYPYGVVQTEWAIEIEKRLGHALGYEVPDPAVGYGLVIVEGESDQQTLFLNGIFSVGIPGNMSWQPRFAEIPLIRNAGDILVVQEPDAEGFPTDISESFPTGHRVFAIKLPVKDPSELWINCYKSAEGDYDKAHEAFLRVWSDSLAKARMLRDGFEFSDTGNAERLVAAFGENFRWLPDTDSYRLWNGKIWESSPTGDNLLPQTKEVVRAIPDKDWALTSESTGKRRGMIALTKGETKVHAKREVFDRNPMLLNAANYTIELETQTAREFRREDYMTKCAPVAYDLFATCPRFDAFLEFIFDGDKDLIHYIVKALGYSLTGDIGEQVFHICHGAGKNGKSTLLELMQMILGPDYATAAKFSTFVATKYPDSSSYDLATLEGARLVTAAEPEKAKRLDESILKQLTGGDLLKARQIYERPIRFHPECKLWLLMNAKPQITGTDEGIWRRVRFIPFNVQIPESMRVKDFHKVLFAEEGSGILNRLLQEGVRDWLAEGLVPPKSVAAATAEFREAQDVIKGFFAEHTITGRRNLHAKAGDLYARYKTWAEANNEYAMRQNEFAEELKRRGFERRTMHGSVQHWFGLTLKDAPQSESGLNFEEPETV